MLLFVPARPQPLPPHAVSCAAVSLLVPRLQDRACRPSSPAFDPATRELVRAMPARDLETAHRPFSCRYQTTPSVHHLRVCVRLPPIPKSALAPHAPVQAIGSCIPPHTNSTKYCHFLVQIRHRVTDPFASLYAAAYQVPLVSVSSWCHARRAGDLVRRKIRLPKRPGGLPRLPAAKPLISPFTIRRLRRSELPADTIALARFLIGKIVVRELAGACLSGRIVETEAYPQRDPAAHHFRGPTTRNRSMFLRRGHAYVYFSYGNHFMLNVSAEVYGIGGGVLIRALATNKGIQQIDLHRKTTRLRVLARRPGRLASALRIDRPLDGTDLCAPGPLWLGAIASPRSSSMEATRALLLGKSPRIGITR